METNSQEQKIRANAVSSYLLLFVSIFFLFNKENTYINNDFVKSHVKTAFSLHLLLLINYIVFVASGVWSQIVILGFSFSNIAAKIIFIWLLWAIILWIYRAQKWERNNIGQIIKIKKIDPEKIIDINSDGNFSERDKLTLLFSYVPFLWFINYGTYYKNKIIRNNTKGNLIVTIVLILLWVYGHNNLANLIALLYTIWAVFVGINMFAANKLSIINLEKIPTMKELSYMVKSLYRYIKNYFWEEEFTSLKNIVEEKIKNDIIKEQKEIEILEKKKGIKIPTFLMYIPYINLIFLFIKDTKYVYHIRNGITLTVIVTILQFLSFIWYYNTQLNLLLLIPICFWIGYAKRELVYKMAFIYDIYEFFVKVIYIFWKKKTEFKEVKNRETEVHLKVKSKNEYHKT